MEAMTISHHINGIEFYFHLKKWSFRVHAARTNVPTATVDIFFFLSFGVEEKPTEFTHDKYVFFWADLLRLNKPLDKVARSFGFYKKI